jgi:6-phosphofructokinase 1
MKIAENLKVQNLGSCTVPNPMRGVRFTLPDENVLLHADFNSIRRYLDSNRIPPEFEAAGPRENIFFNPENLRFGLVTCGGLSPGLNDVIRAVVLSLHHHYGVKIWSSVLASTGQPSLMT